MKSTLHNLHTFNTILETPTTPPTHLFLLSPYPIDRSMTAVGHHNRTLAGSVPQFRDLATPADVHNPWKDRVSVAYIYKYICVYKLNITVIIVESQIRSVT